MEYKHGDRYEIVGFNTSNTYHVRIGNVAEIYTSGTCTIEASTDKSIGGHNIHWYKLKKLEEPMFKEGDVIVTKEGEYKTKILAVCGGCFLESTMDNYAEVGDWCTFEHAKNKGWKLYEAPKDTVTLTTDDGTKIEISKQSLEGLKKL